MFSTMLVPDKSKKKSLPESNTKPPLSCAECRRLKLRCDRAWPCSSCEKRGLAELCPSGSLTTRRRLKSSLNSQNFVQRIYDLQSRINELEDALAALQATVSPHPHPLLPDKSRPYLQQKLMRKVASEMARTRGPGPFTGAEEKSQSENEESEEIAASLGTLSIAPDGKSTFFGPSAVSEGLSTNQRSSMSSRCTELVNFPIDVAALAQSFPFSTLDQVTAEAHDRIRAYLPPLDRGESLCRTYFSHASFVSYIVPQDDVFENLFFKLYGRKRRSPHSSSPQPLDEAAMQYQWHHVTSDELSMFFGILALGALTDVATEPFSAEAELYYRLSTALLTRQTVLTQPTLASIQTLFLGCYYEGMQSQGNSSRDCWIMLVLACKTGQIIGLHRDNSKFGLDEREVERRRRIFWELHSIDTVESLAFGRPLSINSNQLDTKMPTDIYATTNTAGGVEESFYSCKYRFTADVLSAVHDHVLRVKTPTYVSALEADRKVRDFQTTFGRSTSASDANPSTAAQFQMMVGTRETTMLYIHRAFFTHALFMEPDGPEKSKYGRSVVTAYTSAHLIVEGMLSLVRTHREFAARIWFLWNHLLSASFVLGSIVTRASKSSLAPSSLALLDRICELLNETAIYGGRAEYMLPIITRLREKGYNARVDDKRTRGRPEGTTVSGEELGDDELAILGGKTRVVLSGRVAPEVVTPPQRPPSESYGMAGVIPVDTSQQQLGQSAYWEGAAEHGPEQEAYWPPANFPGEVGMGGAEGGQVQAVHSVAATQSSDGEYVQDNFPLGEAPGRFGYGEENLGQSDAWSDGWQRMVRDLGA